VRCSSPHACSNTYARRYIFETAQLFAHYPEECGLGGGVVSFRAGAKYWMLNMIDTGHVQTPHGYECGPSVLAATYTFVWEEIETFAPDGT
jgi:hypothetical protein